VEKATFLSMLMHQLFEEVLRESSSTVYRPVDIAVKLGIVDAVKVREKSNPYDTNADLA
jgi:Fe2+ or Zn2+ uptake regulation protein